MGTILFVTKKKLTKIAFFFLFTYFLSGFVLFQLLFWFFECHTFCLSADTFPSTVSNYNHEMESWNFINNISVMKMFLLVLFAKRSGWHILKCCLSTVAVNVACPSVLKPQQKNNQTWLMIPHYDLSIPKLDGSFLF